jgi:asparagine synthase (glutamine-hydrolysing)
MCGICGVYNHADGEPVPHSLVERMTESIRHRGPDEDGFLFADGVGLGMRRLSIIDLAGGRQPISGETEAISVVFNGEIYNFAALRGELEGRGHTFRTRSDTEVIVHAYEQWGLDGLRKLNGMYGLAIWDAPERRLVLARDPFGVKPLYYWSDGRRLVFGSEVRPILCHPAVDRGVDLEALDQLLTFTFVPAPLTAFKDIRKLKPGYAILADRSGVREVRFFDERPAIDRSRSVGELIEELRDRIEAGVERQMVADVPVGMLLSGGVDSAAIATIASRLTDGPLKTFTVGFEGSFVDNELEPARETARRLGADHHEIVISADAYMDFLPESVRHLEEPVATSSTMPFYKVCELASEHVKVVLTGQGADEPFAGYPRYLAERYAEWYRRLPASLRDHAIGPAVGLLNRSEKAKRATRSLTIEDPLDRFTAVFTAATPSMKAALYAEGLAFSDGTQALRAWQEDVAELDSLSQMLYIDSHTLLPDDLLLYGDKLSMAVSLEARVPYLDLELMSFVQGVPGELKVHHLHRKYLLKRALAKWVPRDVLSRRKVNFATPLDEWLRSRIQERVRMLLLDPASASASYFRPAAIETLLSEHSSGRENHTRVLLSLLTFELWHQEFMRGSGQERSEARPLVIERTPPATLASAPSTGWYVRRLRSMTLREIGARVRLRVESASWGKRMDWDAPAAHVEQREPWCVPRVENQDEADRAAVLAEADEYLAGRYRLLNVEFEEPEMDWHLDPQSGVSAPLKPSMGIDVRDARAVGNVKNIWEKNRHQHLSLLAVAYALTGDARYAQEVERQLLSWQRANPVLVGVNWSSGLEMGLRLVSWVWVERLLRGSEQHERLFGRDGAMWSTIYRHQWLIERTRSYGSSANNHLIGEAAGLFMAASAWSWWPESERWERLGRDILEEEAVAQTFESGFSREQAYAYHVFTAELLLVAAAEAVAAGKPMSERYLTRIGKMAETASSLQDVRGGTPTYGDADEAVAIQLEGSDASRLAVVARLASALTTASIAEPRKRGGRLTTRLLVPNSLVERPFGADVPGSEAYPDAGLYVLAACRGDADEIRCLADAGPLGYLSIAAHGHADALSFTLTVGGTPVIVDPGSYAYGYEGWRKYFRSTAAHNTIVVDGADQSVQAGPFMWTRHAKCRVLEWEETPLGARLVAEHDGYQKDGVTHRRTLELDARDLSVSDELLGLGRHRVSWHLHFAPECEVRLDESTCIVLEPHLEIALDPRLKWRLIRGADRLGWYSPGFNVKQPTATLEGVLEAELPVIFETEIRLDGVVAQTGRAAL